MPEEEKENAEVKTGFLNESLGRTNRQIRQERGDAIAEDLQIMYKRKVEDIDMDITRAVRDQRLAFDFSPTNSQSLVMAKDVKSIDILEQDVASSVKVRELRIRLNIAKDRYNFLFGPTYKLETIV